MKRSLFWLMVLVCAGKLGIAEAATIVGWGGDSVTADVDFTGRGGTYGAGTQMGVWSYTENSTRMSPAEGYTGSTFYWGAYLYRSPDGNASQKNFTFLNVVNNGEADFMRIQRSNSSGASGPTYHGAALVAFKKEDFLSGFDAEELSLTDIQSFSVTTTSSVLTGIRFVVQSNGQWYLSDAYLEPTVTNSPATWTLNGEALAGSLWGAWSPTSGSNGELGATPASFSTAASALTDITALGFFLDLNPIEYAGSTVGAQISAFSVVSIPEPGLMAMVGFGSAVLLSLRRRITLG